jgi:DNA-binding MarR family transcriptional regulator
MTDPSAVEVPDDLEWEFPGASRSASEVTGSLVRTATALVAEVERPPREAANLSVSAFQTLAILDGAGEPLPAHAIAGRLLVSSASMTSLIDTLERRGLIERRPHPTDRRKILIHLTGDAQRIVDQQLPAIHAVIARAISDLTESDRQQLLASLTKIRTRLHALADQPPATPKARRKRSVSSQRCG